ncbi:MAG: transposase [Desulfuromusa sp.]|jgi:putative transposase|nr:transposase [Desulfuromusa sp.]
MLHPTRYYRSMPRTARLDAPGILHHVMIRGIERRNIFRNNKDRNDFLERLAKLIPETGTICYGWAFLSNHAHFLFKTGHLPLSQLMRRLLTGYVVGFNRRHKRHGQLFQNRFKSIVCQEDAYLKELIRYIHLNPIRAGLVNGLKGLDTYSYSGHKAMMGNVECRWLQVDEVLSIFGKSTNSARNAYRRFVEEGLEQGRREELAGGGLVRSAGGWSEVKRDQCHGMSDERILGDSDFVNATLSLAGEALSRRYELKAKGCDLQELATRAADIFQIDIDKIFSPSRQGPIVRARSLVCFWAARELGISLSELARTFKMSAPGIGYAVVRGEKIAKDKKISLVI